MNGLCVIGLPIGRRGSMKNMNKKILMAACITLLLSFTALAQGDKTGTAATAAKTEAAKRGPIFSPTKDQIKQVQAILRDKKLYSIEPSGKYDDDTRAGIKTFQ